MPRAAVKTMAQMEGGVDTSDWHRTADLCRGIYDLMISDLDPRPEGGEEQHTNIGEQPPKPENNLSNVIIVGLIVAAFKKTIGLEVNIATDL